MVITNRLLYQLSYVGFWRDHPSLSNRRRSHRGSSETIQSAGKKVALEQLKLCGASGNQALIFVLGFAGQQHPHRVNAHRCSNRNINEQN